MADPAGIDLDLDSAELTAAELAAAPARGTGPLRVRGAVVTGRLALVGARIERPVELLGCTFTEVPDLRMAEFGGLALTGCRVPGLQAGNLRVTADLLLNDGFVADGPVHLQDAHVGASLRLSTGGCPGAAGRPSSRTGSWWRARAAPAGCAARASCACRAAGSRATSTSPARS